MTRERLAKIEEQFAKRDFRREPGFSDEAIADELLDFVKELMDENEKLRQERAPIHG